MIIRPYSEAANYSSGGRWEPTQANFPALKHFFKCDETSGLTLTDAINSVVLTMTTKTYPSAGKTTFARSGTDNALTSGSWVAPTTNDALVVIIGNMGLLGNIRIGDATSGSNDSILVNPAIGSSIRDNTTTATANVATQNAEHANGVFWSITDDAIYAFDTNGGAYTEAASVAVTGVTSIATLDSVFSISGTQTNVSAIQVWHFADGLPNNIGEAMLWTEYYSKLNSKYCYPGWAGLE